MTNEEKYQKLQWRISFEIDNLERNINEIEKEIIKVKESLNTSLLTTGDLQRVRDTWRDLMVSKGEKEKFIRVLKGNLVDDIIEYEKNY